MLSATNSTPANFGLSFYLEIVSLVFIAFIIWKYVWAGGINLRGMMSAKETSIATQLSAGDEARAQAAALVDQKRAELAAAQIEAAAIVSQSESAAAEVVVEGQRRAAEDYQRIIQRAAIEIDSALARVRAEVAASASALIVKTVERVISVELDSTSHHRLIGEAISATETEGI